MDLLEYRNAIISTVKARLPGLRACEPHAGRFDLDELKKISTALPAVRIAIMGVPQVESDGDGCADNTLQVVMYCVAGNAPRLSASDACLNMVGFLTAFLTNGERWNLTNLSDPLKIGAENLYNAPQGENAVCLWAVSFRQIVRIGQSEFESLPEFLAEALYLGRAPEIGADHVDDYVQIYPEE
ncbi:MAG: hypothetical protein SFY80_03055 [Verrucomicrobiota bacterium]|nr:hypothetical protein [Verrucomicrobiota bacterium]